MKIQKNAQSLFLVYYLLFSLFSPVLGMESVEHEISSIVQNCRPNRDQPIPVIGRNEQFLSYYTSGEGLSCGFRIFGLERKEGVDLIKNNLHRNTVKTFVWNAIQADSSDQLKIIFPYFDSANFNINNSLDNLIVYLDYFYTPDIMLNVQENRNEKGQYIQRPFEYGLMDAMAYILNRSLYVYIPNPEDEASFLLKHSFYMPTAQDCVYAQFTGLHFNFLAKSTDLIAQAKAQEHEETNLAKLYQLLINESQSFLTEEVFDNSQDVEIEDEFYIEETLEESNENSAQETPTYSFTYEQVVKFIDQQKEMKTLPGLTRRKSLEEVYDYLAEGMSQQENPLPYVFGFIRLFLELNYHPENITQQEQASKIYKLIKALPKFYHLPPKLSNYLKIYEGKTLILLNQFDEAYKCFQTIGKQYTKTYLTDIADMILEHGYKPSDMGNTDPYTYVETLIKTGMSVPEDPIRPKTKRRASKNENVSTIDFEMLTIAHPQFINRPATRKILEKHKLNLNKKRLRPTKNQKKYEEQSHKRQKLNSLSSIRKDQNQSKVMSPSSSANPIISEQEDDISNYNSQTPIDAIIIQEEELISVNQNVISEEIAQANLNSAELEEGEIEEEENPLYLSTRSTYQEQREEIIKLLVFGRTSSNDEDARSYYKRSLQIAIKIEDKKFQALAYIGLGNSRVRDQIECHEKALQIAEEIGDKILQIKALIGLGHARVRNAMECFEKALQIAEEIGNEYYQVQALIGLGNVYSGELNDDQTAYDFYESAYKIARSPGLIQRARSGMERVSRFLGNNR